MIQAYTQLTKQTKGAVTCIMQVVSGPASVGIRWSEGMVSVICNAEKGDFSNSCLSCRCLIDYRYSNMDYIFWSAVNSYKGRQITVSYDIMCQWYRNLLKRNANLPELLRRLDFVLRYVIPKFHISAHGPKCQTIFSFNFLPFMARTDGENIERGWAWMNPVSLSTREMGPGARHDTLDCQWSAWNWRIITRLGMFSCKYYASFN